MNTHDRKPLRLLLVDDSEVVRMGLKALLGSETDISVVGEASTVDSAIQSSIKLQPDVVLLDIRLPDGTGFEACRKILQHLPETRILILTSVEEPKLVDEAIRSGAHGYLLKDINAQGLIRALHDIAAGKSILDPTVTARVLHVVRSTTTSNENAFSILSPQERRVLALIAEGRTNKEVAMEMGLAEKTVKNYLSTVFEKLHVNRRSQAAAVYAQRMQQTRSDSF
jgi:two-component system, NarL family, response regulator DevR|uniref:response regulator transcription factor n=1 Tax=Cephaloticoccus sp. TaxID=1985742 RepID=UPI0040494E7B